MRPTALTSMWSKTLRGSRPVWCAFCTVPEEGRHLRPEVVAQMRGGRAKRLSEALLGQPRTVEYALAAAVRLKVFADTAAIVFAIRQYCMPRPARAEGAVRRPVRPPADGAKLEAALRARGITPVDQPEWTTTRRNAAFFKELATAMHSEPPDDGNPVGLWLTPVWKRHWEKECMDSDDDEVYVDCRNFATASSTGTKDVQRTLMHFPPLFENTIIGTHGHMGPPTTPAIPWDHKCAGPFHTASHHRTTLAKLAAEVLAASGKLKRFGESLVAVGCDNFQTKALEKLSIPGRRKPCADAFDGPYGITFMWNFPEIVKSSFNLDDVDERRSAEYLLEGWRFVRKFHKLMLCIDRDIFRTLGGPAALRAAERELNDWVINFDAETTHPRLEHAKAGLHFYNSALHNMMHVCNMADLLWKVDIPIGRATEQGPEGLNKVLEVEVGCGIGKHGNGHMNPVLTDNMLAIGLTHMHRQNFQRKELPLRAGHTCRACLKCVPGCAPKDQCARYPDCLDEEKTPIKLPHKQAGQTCWHNPKYTGTAHHRDIAPTLDNIQSLW